MEHSLRKLEGNGRRSAVINAFSSFLPSLTPSLKWQLGHRASFSDMGIAGEAPLVVARGGYSGVFPDSSQYAFDFAISTSVHNSALLCDLQFTKDGAGLCRTDLRLDNSTNIVDVFPEGKKTYKVNGESVTGWFGIDYISDDLLTNVSAIQNSLSRPTVYDATLPLSLLDDLKAYKAQTVWVNVQYEMFFKQHGQDVQAYLVGMSNDMTIHYISSPEIGFLKSISGKTTKGKTKFIFRFQDADAVEPSTNKTYGNILKDLSSIKSFASGILVPKNYIWPVNKDQYLLPPTTVVTDAHKAGLEIYAYGFANDRPGSYNYSYDPVAEYLQFIDNDEFCVDGVISDFPSTASEAIVCFAHNQKNKKGSKERPLVISHNGASGVYPGCTDLAYIQAVEDGADIIDCPVQISKDALPFCFASPDLVSETTAVTSFMSRMANVPEIQQDSGIFTFDLTWSEIQSLTPELVSPGFDSGGLLRNPEGKNKGKFTTLADFLNIAKDRDVSGILIDIENAPYLASKQGLDIIDAVTSALTKSGFDKMHKKRVLIQSEDSAVLSKFKDKFPSFQRVLSIPELISDVSKAALDEIKQSADAVNLPRGSIIANRRIVLDGYTNVTDTMAAANISVYASVFRNEYPLIAFDFFSDPVMELCTYIQGTTIDGVVTDFPLTASRYMRSPCFEINVNDEYSLVPVEPGFLLSLAQKDVVPIVSPSPSLSVADVMDPPLPPVIDADGGNAGAPGGEGPRPSGSQPSKNAITVALCLLLAGLNFIASS
ncbi:hypothetical protein ACLOJK_017313 [Asimina triloba]